jgi:hypothetical protein
MQKVFFPKIFNVDLSRLKIDVNAYKKITYLIFINLVLTINIIFFSVEIALKAFSNLLKNINYLTLLQISLIIFIFYKNFYYRNFYKKNKNNKYLLLILSLVFFSVIFLNAAMHALANTGLEFIQYNNRALVSLSFIYSLTIVLVYKLFNFNNRKLFNFILICLFSVPIVNFIYFQNNLIKERFDAKHIYNEFLHSKKSEFKANNINFILSESKDDVDYILSYNSLDYFNYLEKNFLIIFLTANKFCNINYYDEYINIPYLRNSDNNISVYNFEKFPYGFTHVIQMKNVDSIRFRDEISKTIKCNHKISNFMSKELNKKVYLDSKYDGYFLKIAKYFYFKFL